ncbi:MAG: patatin-like phospholipase family protein [Betaproteobacteria bacterium]|nr:patatin-like phospholipase family protein [Betaproteobacteria bacterium]
MVFPRLCLAAVAFLAGAVLAAPDAFPQASVATRPKVGLVLGGGGARGGAHLGVLEVLEELRVPFDCVAGTSMGALVSGAFVAGVTLPDMTEKIAKTDWARMFDDTAGRDQVGLRNKQFDDRFYSGLEFGVTKDGLRYREGAVAGEKIKLFFNDLVRADLGDRRIEQLPLPLTLIATDIGTGERVAMRSGELTSAMRASMSVPGAIAPVERDGHKLVDGGLVDNLPVQEVRDRCGAEVVIAVNVGSPLYKPEEVTSVLSVMGQMVNLLTEQNVSKSLSLLGPRDIYMRPALGEFSAMAFSHQLEAAAIGREAALGVADKLRALSVSPEEYRAWQAKLRTLPRHSPPVVDEVRVATTRFVNPEELRAGVRQKDGEVLDSQKLSEDLVLLYSRGDLQTLDYSVLSEREKTILRLAPSEKAWGPDYLRFGINLATDFSSDTPYNLRALFRKTWINSFGGEWLTIVQVGSKQAVGMEFYQPLDYRQRTFIRPYAAFTQRTAGLYFDGDRLADYSLREGHVGLDVGLNLGIYGMASVGLLEQKGRSSLSTGSPVLPDSKGNIGGISASVALDTLDFAFFPTKGYKADLDFFQAERVSDNLSKYGRVDGRLGGAWSPNGDYILLGSVQGGMATQGNPPLNDAFSLGGFRRLSAFAPGQILGVDAYGVATVEAQYRLNKPIPILGLSVLAGVTYEAGYMKNPITEPNLTGGINSFGVYLASNTAFGPIYFGYSTTSAKDRGGRVYFFIGTP